MLNDFEGDKDMANLRTVALPDGTEVKINRTDPYGLMTIDYQDKKTPDELSGSYTTYEQARMALRSYLISIKSNKRQKK